MKQRCTVTEQVCENIQYKERCRDVTIQKLGYMDKKTRGYEWADDLTLICLREADRVSDMTPTCLLVEDRSKRGHTQPTLYMDHLQSSSS